MLPKYISPLLFEITQFGVGDGGSDPGAVKYLVEKDINLKIALTCINFLETNEVKWGRLKNGAYWICLTYTKRV